MKRLLALGLVLGMSALGCMPFGAPVQNVTAQNLAGTWTSSYQALYSGRLTSVQQTMVITPVTATLFTALKSYTFTLPGAASPTTLTETSLGAVTPSGQFTMADQVGDGYTEGQLVSANTINETFAQSGEINPVVYAATFTRQ